VPDLPITRVYLVRHCDVRNPDGVLYGHLPEFPLSEKGIEQAHALGRFFQDKPVRRIYTSPLERATQTAGIIASHVAGIPVDLCAGLIEAKFGHYIQGIRPRAVPWRRPLWFVHMMWPGLLPNDESVREMAARLRGPVERLVDEFPGEGGVCVSHGDPIQAFWVAAEGRPPYALHRLQCRKGGLLELDYSGKLLTGLTYRSPDDIAAAAPLSATKPGLS
jgi:broad specificity phosphatase PhoE